MTSFLSYFSQFVDPLPPPPPSPTSFTFDDILTFPSFSPYKFTFSLSKDKLNFYHTFQPLPNPAKSQTSSFASLDLPAGLKLEFHQKSRNKQEKDSIFKNKVEPGSSETVRKRSGTQNLEGMSNSSLIRSPKKEFLPENLQKFSFSVLKIKATPIENLETFGNLLFSRQQFTSKLGVNLRRSFHNVKTSLNLASQRQKQKVNFKFWIKPIQNSFLLKVDSKYRIYSGFDLLALGVGLQNENYEFFFRNVSQKKQAGVIRKINVNVSQKINNKVSLAAKYGIKQQQQEKDQQILQFGVRIRLAEGVEFKAKSVNLEKLQTLALVRVSKNVEGGVRYDYGEKGGPVGFMLNVNLF